MEHSDAEFLKKELFGDRRHRALGDLIKGLFQGEDLPPELRDTLGGLSGGFLGGLLNDLFDSEQCASANHAGRAPGRWPNGAGGSWPNRAPGGRSNGAGGGASGARGRGIPVNTFPAGRKTRDIYPVFVGACAGKDGPDRVMNAALDYCGQAGQVLDWYTPKLVLILTDKWNDPVFQKKYARKFLRYSLSQNILVIFVLVTELDLTRIPFYPESWSRISDLHRQGCRVEDLAPLTPGEQCLADLDGYPIQLRAEHFRPDPAGGYVNSEIVTYDIDLHRRMYAAYVWNTPRQRSGRLREQRIEAFAEAAAELMALPPGMYHAAGQGGPGPGGEIVEWRMELPDRVFAWDSTVDSGQAPWAAAAGRAFSELAGPIKIS